MASMKRAYLGARGGMASSKIMKNSSVSVCHRTHTHARARTHATFIIRILRRRGRDIGRTLRHAYAAAHRRAPPPRARRTPRLHLPAAPAASVPRLFVTPPLPRVPCLLRLTCRFAGINATRAMLRRALPALYRTTLHRTLHLPADLARQHRAPAHHRVTARWTRNAAFAALNVAGRRVVADMGTTRRVCLYAYGDAEHSTSRTYAAV